VPRAVCADCPERLAVDRDGAFATFLAHHQDLVYGIAWRMTGRSADAEDLAQDAFVSAYRALRTYRPDRIRALQPRAWMATIVSNAGRNRARRRRPPSVPLDDAAASSIVEPRPGPEALTQRREAARAWGARLDALPRRYREAVTLRHVEGLSYPEVAAALERPVGTVKSDVHRGVRLLRDAWVREDGALTMEGRP
jgi:RNA polymerase sigma-70 factor (ECF subfamily)